MTWVEVAARGSAHSFDIPAVGSMFRRRPELIEAFVEWAAKHRYLYDRADAIEIDGDAGLLRAIVGGRVFPASVGGAISEYVIAPALVPPEVVRATTFAAKMRARRKGAIG